MVNIKATVSKLLDIAINNGRESVRFFLVPDDEQEEWIGIVAGAFETDDNRTFVYKDKVISMYIDDGYLVAGIADRVAKAKPVRRTLEEHRQWWKENNPHMLDEPPKPLFDHNLPKW